MRVPGVPVAVAVIVADVAVGLAAELLWTPCGGVAVGTTEFDGAEGVESPPGLTAVTVNV